MTRAWSAAPFAAAGLSLADRVLRCALRCSQQQPDARLQGTAGMRLPPTHNKIANGRRCCDSRSLASPWAMAPHPLRANPHAAQQLGILASLLLPHSPFPRHLSPVAQKFLFAPCYRFGHSSAAASVAAAHSHNGARRRYVVMRLWPKPWASLFAAVVFAVSLR